MGKAQLYDKLCGIAKSQKSKNIMYYAANAKEKMLLRQLHLDMKIALGGFRWGIGPDMPTITIR